MTPTYFLVLQYHPANEVVVLVYLLIWSCLSQERGVGLGYTNTKQIPIPKRVAMASLLCPTTTISLQHKVNHISLSNIFANAASFKICQTIAGNRRSCRCFKTKARMSVEGEVLEKQPKSVKNDIGVVSLHHVGILCGNLERSLEFYQNLLGLEINEARPDDKLPYRGAWLWVGSGMIHLMELPNPDPLTGRPEHGGRDRHTCIAIKNVSKLKEILDKADIPYTLSRSGRPAIFFRDPDANALEFAEFDD